MKIVVALSLVLVLITACQKEIDWGLDNNASDRLLVKVLSKTGNDSTIVTYNYNTAKLLVQERTTGFSGGTTVDNDMQIIRTTSGIIEKVIMVNPDLASQGLDSIVRRYNFNAATSRYTSAIFTVSVSGTDI